MLHEQHSNKQAGSQRGRQASKQPSTVQCRVYDYGLKHRLSDADWNNFFAGKSADVAAESFTTDAIEAVDAHILSERTVDRVCAHPWLNDERPSVEERRRGHGRVRDTARRVLENPPGHLPGLSGQGAGQAAVASLFLQRVVGTD